MPRDEAFLQAVRDNPDDDAPRLIYADFLEENGQAERAELIRVQVDRARLPEGDSRARKLLTRERALLGAHAEWYPAKLGIQAEWRRGFVEHLTLSPEYFRLYGEELFARFPVRSLRLRQIQGPSQLRELASSPLLTRLNALGFESYSGLTDDGLEALLASPHLAGLQSLTLPSNNLTRAAWALARAEHLRRLTALSFHGLGPADLGLLLAAPHLAGLTRLGLTYTYIGPDGARALADPPRLRQLAHLDLSYSRIQISGVRALAASPNFSALESLALNRNRLGVLAAKALARSPHLARLRVLELNSNRLGDDGARELAGSPHLAGLNLLRLRKNGITPAGAAALGESPHLTRLTTLDLANNPIPAPQRGQLKARFGRRFARF